VQTAAMTMRQLPYDFAVDNHNSTLWALRNERARRIECLLRLTPVGAEIEILSEGSSLLRHRFDSRAEAVAWAADVRRICSRDDASRP
jgi:hypothetical protein